MNYNSFFDQALVQLKLEGNYRTFADLERKVGHFPEALFHTEKDGQKTITSWCSNDYLGMGQHPGVLKVMHETLDKMGAGAGGTRNIGGTNHYHVLLEQKLAELHDKERALLFSSAYVANEAALSTLASRLPNCLILSDENNHASIIHGIRHSRAEKVIFRHNDIAQLESILQAADFHRPKLIVFQSIYSMDGDFAPIEQICDLADRYNALTYIDEVHAVGLYGARGAGISEMLGLSHRPTLVEGTFGKAYGLMGGYIAGPNNVIDFVRSFAPGFIFTTALPPALCAGALTSVEYLMNSQVERKIHQERVCALKNALDLANIAYMQTESHIVPIIIGEAHLCRQASYLLLQDHDIYIQPINHPTVPVGTERLRLTVTPFHTDDMIQKLVAALTDVLGKLKLQVVAA